MDKSELDAKYFIDAHVYNCPFCNRKNVLYRVLSHYVFDWTTDKKCRVYHIICSSCENISMHLSYENIPLEYYNEGRVTYGRFVLNEQNLDDLFFYSVPTSFFTLDNTISRELRELMSEAEGCLKGNFLTGASACARKMIYELAKREDAEGDNYDQRIKSLKRKFNTIDASYFDTLLTIQEITSDKVHEESYDGWESKHLRLILSTIVEILNEIYVIPNLRKKKREHILQLREEILKGKEKKESDATPQDSGI